MAVHCLAALASVAQPAYAPVVDGILSAWNSHDVVCLGEDHGRKHDSDLRLALVKHPKLAAGLRNRGRNIRNIIAQQVLDKKLKALAIYGSLHCVKIGMGFPGELMERYPGRIWSVGSLAVERGASG